jgi:hypothetical protein
MDKKRNEIKRKKNTGWKKNKEIIKGKERGKGGRIGEKTKRERK